MVEIGMDAGALSAIAAAALLGLGMLLMREPGRVLKKTGIGIVRFELAGSSERCHEILEAWGTEGKAAARRHIFGDLPFLVGYGVLLFLVCWCTAPIVGEKTWAWAGTLGRLFGLLAATAAMFDLLEDLALLWVLGRDSNRSVQPASRLARTLASAKFCVLATVVLWLLLVEIPVLVAPSY